MTDTPDLRVLVTGASSGIGAAKEGENGSRHGDLGVALALRNHFPS